MKKRFGVFILLLFLLNIFSVLAINGIYDSVENEVFSGSNLIYTLYVTNDEQSPMLIKILNIDADWVLADENKLYAINTGEQVTIPLVFTPRNQMNPKNAIINILIKDGEITRLNRLLSYHILDYKNVLNVGFSESPVINPLRGAILKLKVENKNRIKLDNINLKLKSLHFDFSKDISLDRLESNILEFPVKVNPSVEEGDYDANVIIMLGDKELINTNIKYTVSKYENVKDQIVEEDRFFYGGETLTRINVGNSEVTQVYSKNFDSINYKLSKFNPKPTKVVETNEGYTVQWDVTLKPGESKDINYVIDYRTPILFIVLILILFAAWYVFRKRNVIIIEKRVMTIHGHEGNLHIMKIVLNIRNRGNMAINNLKLIDRIPNSIKAPTQYGVFKPNTIKAMPEGTVMVWDINSIRRNEEKILSYRIEGKFLSNVNLPPATVKYVLFGRSVVAKSISVSLKGKK